MENPANSGILRPCNSDKGPNSSGPKLNTGTKRLVSGTMTSSETSNFIDVGMVAVLKRRSKGHRDGNYTEHHCDGPFAGFAEVRGVFLSHC